MKDNIWIYGRHSVLSVLLYKQRTINKIIIAENRYEEFIASLTIANIEINTEQICIVKKAYFKAILPKDAVHQGYALLTSTRKALPLKETLSKLAQQSIVLLLDDITDSRNIGAIMRSSSLFNICYIICTKHSFPSENSFMLKTSAGASELINIITVSNLKYAIHELKKMHFWIIGIDKEGTMNISNIHSYD